jgi:hypothetical protein
MMRFYAFEPVDAALPAQQNQEREVVLGWLQAYYNKALSRAEVLSLVRDMESREETLPATRGLFRVLRRAVRPGHSHPAVTPIYGVRRNYPKRKK